MSLPPFASLLFGCLNNASDPLCFIAQAVLITDAMEGNDGPTKRARQAIEGPLTEELNLNQIFEALPKVIEANRAFTEAFY